MPEELLPKPQVDLPLPEKEIPAHLASQDFKGNSVFKSKFFILFVGISFLIAFLIGGFMLAN